jgi:hypothetical protein
MKNTEYNSIKDWETKTKRVYNMFKNMPKEQLYFLGNFAGLDLNYYKNKSMLAKALTSELSWSCTPINMKEWK